MTVHKDHDAANMLRLRLRSLRSLLVPLLGVGWLSCQ
jgi:hypothetical protein